MQINCRGTLIDLSSPKVMGILNITPDSFFDGGKYIDEDSILRQVQLMLSEGADFIDIGATSSRPGAKEVTEEEELKRLLPAVKTIIKNFPQAIISVDTFRSAVAEKSLQTGAHIINDITAGSDEKMFETVSRFRTPYIMMHMQGTPQTMQQNPVYTNVVKEVQDFFISKLKKIKQYNIIDLILDVGFGFGKTVEHNFELLKNLELFKITGLPMLAGLSRKSMICKTLNVKPDDALNGTTALNMVALMKGAKILRVHDVKEAKECCRLFEKLTA
jgi:dihydropteroate synthase